MPRAIQCFNPELVSANFLATPVASLTITVRETIGTEEVIVFHVESVLLGQITTTSTASETLLMVISVGGVDHRPDNWLPTERTHLSNFVLIAIVTEYLVIFKDKSSSGQRIPAAITDEMLRMPYLVHGRRISPSDGLLTSFTYPLTIRHLRLLLGRNRRGWGDHGGGRGRRRRSLD
jgi:hypothetical protein